MIFPLVLFGATFIRAKMTKSLKEYGFVNSALKVQCHVVKTTLLQTASFGDFTHWENRLISIVAGLLSLYLSHLYLYP